MTMGRKRMLGAIRRTMLAGTIVLTATGIALVAIPGADTVLGLMSISLAATSAAGYTLMSNKRICVSIFDEDI